MSALVIEMQKISRRFDATQSLDGVSIALHKGDVHALLGENSAGKSTLIKIIAGIHRTDQRARGEVA
jgi:ABC-type sugar transport system ATPase subunit